MTVKKNKLKIAVLGAGSWGIALANLASQLGHTTKLWEFDEKIAGQLRIDRRREQVLKNTTICPDIDITSDLNAAIEGAEIILLVVPSHVARTVIQKLGKCRSFRHSQLLVSCAKGIENESLSRISEIVRTELADYPEENFAVLSGPSHAEEVSKGIITAVVVASKNEKNANKIQKALNSSTFRMYRSRDVIGVELGGALKNVIAIAAGICDGAGFGDNTKAALQPRGLAEMARLGRKFDANPLTFAGLSGMGDLIVTCMSQHSRNRYVGEQIGSGKTLEQVLDGMTMVAEGVRTSRSAVELANRLDVEMPICQQVYKVLFEQKDAKHALKDLMRREVKPEIWY